MNPKYLTWLLFNKIFVALANKRNKPTRQNGKNTQLPKYCKYTICKFCVPLNFFVRKFKNCVQMMLLMFATLRMSMKTNSWLRKPTPEDDVRG